MDKGHRAERDWIAAESFLRCAICTRPTDGRERKGRVSRAPRSSALIEEAPVRRRTFADGDDAWLKRKERNRSLNSALKIGWVTF